MEHPSASLPAEIIIFDGAMDSAANVACPGDFLILFVHSGIFRLLIDGKKVICTSGELFIAVSREYYRVLKSKKVLCYFVKVQRHFIVDTRIIYHFADAFIGMSQFRLTPDEFDTKTYIRIMKLLAHLYQARSNFHRFSRMTFTHLVSLLIFHAGWQYGNTATGNVHLYNRKETLTIGFVKLLLKHFRQEQTIGFYAGVLCVTTGYLNKAVREVSGRTAGQCIAEIIISEAKYQLVQREQSITAISITLNFASPGSFSRFFKKHTLLTPAAYRRIAAE